MSEIEFAEIIERDFAMRLPIVKRRALIMVAVRQTAVEPPRYACSLTFDAPVLETLGAVRLGELVTRQITEAITKTAEM